MKNTTNLKTADKATTRTRRELPAYTLPATGDAFIPDVKVAAAIDCGLSTVWHRVRHDPTFPRPIRLGERCTRFSVAQLREWIASKAAATAAAEPSGATGQ